MVSVADFHKLGSVAKGIVEEEQRKMEALPAEERDERKLLENIGVRLYNHLAHTRY